MKTLISLCCLIILTGFCHAQITIKDSAQLSFLKYAAKTSFKQSPPFNGSRLDRIGNELRRGDKSALLAIAPYFDSTTTVTEFLGYHILHPQQRSIAKRMVIENCSFLKTEIDIDSSSSIQFFSFLKNNFADIIFDKDAAAFLLTPFSNRDALVEIRDLTPGRKNELLQKADKLLNLAWVKANYINIQVDLKQPRALYEIAAAFYRIRNRFNIYSFNHNEFVELLQYLTGTDIGVENEQKKITHHIDKEYSPDASLNLLIYFARYANDYTWDVTKKTFVNNKINAVMPGNENAYFEALSSKVDSVAMNAFIKLTISDPIKVAALANEYDRADINVNHSLPIFPYRFLKQLTILTEYCRNNDINYSSSVVLRQDIVKLKSGLSFLERRQLEDKLINKLTLQDITAFEYQCLIDEQERELTYSAGRILDVFYSKNWNALVSNKKMLELFLKKAALYNKLGIIGICNRYLNKFINSDLPALAIIKKHVSNDKDVVLQVLKAISLASLNKTPKQVNKSDRGNYDSDIVDLQNAFVKIIKTVKDTTARNDSITALYSKINYKQIGTALKLIEKVTFKKNWGKYYFMNRDFGFFTEDFEDAGVRKDFINYYSAHTEYETYTYYLTKTGIDYRKPNKTIDYDKVYDLLKYDEATAFAGGGGGKQLNEEYLLIKLLELTFKTTLGFPKKLCNSNNMYACYARERALEWRAFLKEKMMLKSSHNEPVSFSYLEN